MPTNLHRYYGAGYSHFITTSCYQRRLLLDTPHSRDLFLQVMEQVRQRHQFVVIGYVVMPEHVHLLLSEPDRGNPSLVLAALKQTFAHRLIRELRANKSVQTNQLWNTPLAAGHIWQRRFYDFVVFTEKKRVEKLRYMHRNRGTLQHADKDYRLAREVARDLRSNLRDTLGNLIPRNQHLESGHGVSY